MVGLGGMGGTVGAVGRGGVERGGSEEGRGGSEEGRGGAVYSVSSPDKLAPAAGHLQGCRLLCLSSRVQV